MTHQTIEIQAGLAVAVVWLNRPEVRNAFNDTMIAELTAVFGELERGSGGARGGARGTRQGVLCRRGT